MVRHSLQHASFQADADPALKLVIYMQAQRTIRKGM
jgi:hypothetical protein